MRVVTDDPAGRLVAGDLGARLVDDPGSGQGDAVATGLEGGVRPLPRRQRRPARVRPSDLNALAVPALLGRLALIEAHDGTTNALGLPRAEIFAPLYGPGSAARFATMRRGSESTPRRWRSGTSSTTSTRSATSSGSAHVRGRAPRSSSKQSRFENRVPVRRRRRGEARLRPAGRPGAGRADGDRQRRRRRRCARAARLARSRLGALRARRAERRGARVGSRRRDLAGTRGREAVGRRGVVHARRPRSRAPPRAHAGAPDGRSALGGHGAPRRGGGSRDRAAAGDGRPAPDVGRDAGRHVPVPGVVRRPPSRGRGRGDGVRRRRQRGTRCGRPRGDPRRRRGRRRAEQPVHLDPTDPRGRRDPCRGRRSQCAHRCRQPAHRRPRRQGPARPYAHAHGGRHLTGACSRSVTRA